MDVFLLSQSGLHSHAYNTSLWVVPKKPGQDGKPKWRVVLDFRSLNEKTIPMTYSHPNITDISDQVGNSRYYSVIDCATGFHQIALDEADAHKTNKQYIDDIVIYAKTLEEYEKLFDEAMSRLRKYSWKLEPKKCEILQREVTYLGHIISVSGLNPDPKKVEAVRKFPKLKNAKGVRQFLGLAGYYRLFIKYFAKIAKPLTKLLQKNETFNWTKDAENAFENLKEILCSAPLLQSSDMNKPFLITTDASGYAVGGILLQGKIGRDIAIAYTSRVLRGPELKYDTYEKEALAVIHAVRTYRPYVFGRKFTIVTDHQPLIWFKTADLNTRVQKWRFKLSDYKYEIIYKLGKMNVNADALSTKTVITKHVNILTRRQALERNRSRERGVEGKQPKYGIYITGNIKSD